MLKSDGDTCPKCKSVLVRRPGMFYWRGDIKDGLVCEKCNALWGIKEEAIAPLAE